HARSPLSSAPRALDETEIAMDASRVLAAAVERGDHDAALPVPVVLPRPRRDHAPAITEVRGLVTLGTARAAAGTTPVGALAVPPSVVLGTGERARDVLDRWGVDDAGHAAVLRDGRLVAVVPRDRVAALAAEPLPSAAGAS